MKVDIDYNQDELGEIAECLRKVTNGLIELQRVIEEWSESARNLYLLQRARDIIVDLHAKQGGLR